MFRSIFVALAYVAALAAAMSASRASAETPAGSDTVRPLTYQSPPSSDAREGQTQLVDYRRNYRRGRNYYRGQRYYGYRYPYRNYSYRYPSYYRRGYYYRSPYYYGRSYYRYPNYYRGYSGSVRIGPLWFGW